MNKQGHIRLKRAFMDWRYYSDPSTCRLFEHFLLSANFVDVDYMNMQLKKGQRLTTLMELKEETGLTLSQIRTALHKLVAIGEVGTKKTLGRTLITVYNYDSYIEASQTNNMRLTQEYTEKSQSDDKKPKKISPTPPYKENKKESKNEKENIDATSNEVTKKNSRFMKPTIEEIQAYIDQKGYSFSAEDFFNYYESVGWKVGATKKAMKSWKASCSLWQSKEKKNNKSANSLILMTDLEQKAMQAFLSYYENETKESYIWNGNSDSWAIKSLLGKIKKSRGERDNPLPTDDDSMIEAFELFLKNIKDQWIKEHLSVTLIDSKYNEIVRLAKKNRKIEIPDGVRLNEEYGERLMEVNGVLYKTYGDRGVKVPLNAPPRPRRDAFYDADSGHWV